MTKDSGTWVKNKVDYVSEEAVYGQAARAQRAELALRWFEANAAWDMDTLIMINDEALVQTKRWPEKVVHELEVNPASGGYREAPGSHLPFDALCASTSLQRLQQPAAPPATH